MAADFMGDIEGQPTKIEFGDIAAKKVDGYIVPQFSDGVSIAGVAQALTRAGARQGMEAYKNHLDQRGGKIPFGDVCITTSGGGNSKYLLHVASVDSGKENEYSTIQKAVYAALVHAQKRGLKTVASPALGTGVIGKLTPTQSARAMMSAVHRFVKDGGKFDEIVFVIYDSQKAVDEFASVLRDKSYENRILEPGLKPFDFEKWSAQFRDLIMGDRAPTL